jgi:hypothetical protein
MVVATLAGACSLPGSGTGRSQSPAASSTRTSSPSASPSANSSQSPSPAPLTGAYGVLVSPLSGSNYTVSLVGIDGRVVASAQATTPSPVSCANAAAAITPLPVSASNSRLYYMDALGAVRTLSPDSGVTAPVVTLPIGPSRRSLFAVSPDDALMAVVVIDFTTSGATSRLYMYQLQPGGSQLLLFSQSGAYALWPTGWHGVTNLVVAKVPSCTQGGGPFCCGPQEFHVVDPKTAFRRFTVGSAACVIAGPPTQAGAVCEDTAAFAQLNVVDWTGATTHSYPISGATPAYLSPDGMLVAIAAYGAPITTILPTNAAATLAACGWIDNTHLLSGGDVQHQPSVADITTGKVVPVATQGDCAGRLPGGL